jgi:hypothetical protein
MGNDQSSGSKYDVEKAAAPPHPTTMNATVGKPAAPAAAEKKETKTKAAHDKKAGEWLRSHVCSFVCFNTLNLFRFLRRF